MGFFPASCLVVLREGVMATGVAAQTKSLLKQSNLGAPVFLLIIMAMMTLPMPPFLLDMLFTFNI